MEMSEQVQKINWFLSILAISYITNIWNNL